MIGKDSIKRTPAKKMASKMAGMLKKEKPNYDYLREVFRHLRKQLDVQVTKKPKKLPYVPTEEEIKAFYEAVWKSNNMKNLIIIKTFLYTGIRVSELVNVKLDDLDLEQCRIRINDGKGGKDRMVPFPETFKIALAVHAQNMKKDGAEYLFESSWKKQYTDRGIRKILKSYSEKAGLKHSVSPHRLRHFLLTWMKKQKIDDAFIQPYSGHESRQSLEVYSRLAISDAQKEYNRVIKEFPV